MSDLHGITIANKYRSVAGVRRRAVKVSETVGHVVSGASVGVPIWVCNVDSSKRRNEVGIGSCKAML